MLPELLELYNLNLGRKDSFIFHNYVGFFIAHSK